MRFHANGPAIPDYLLQKRDEGRCVFLCGAGVSIPAGMPTFVGLAQYVIDKLDPDENGDIMRDFLPWKTGGNGAKTPLDQLFNSLYQEYGRDEVNAIVSECLGAPRNDDQSDKHRLICRISSDLDHRPQVVTTNFDRLFEFGQDELSQVRVAPTLPVLEHGDSITGITYLHGHIGQPDSYVLGSADFGRAYLAEAWATNFIRELIKHHTVVLVGYSADDPPVKYLLQGLSQNGGIDQRNLYAFDRGRHEDIETKWRDRGVTPIAYSGEGNDHLALWDTFEAWAERADDPRAWRGKVIDLARKGPRLVEGYQRGQVAHVVRTTAGARAFANAEPKITAEWLCVLDVNRRIAEPLEGYGEDAEIFDPLETYGLDDDPARPPANSFGQARIHDHLLGWRPGDDNPESIHDLGAFLAADDMPLPSRLRILASWISKHLDSPIAAWWAFRQRRLHPRFLKFVRDALIRQKDLPSDARGMWNVLVEMHTAVSADRHGSRWFGSMIDVEGWSNHVIREFENFLLPAYVMGSLGGIKESKPPLGSWANTDVKDIANLSVKFPDLHQQNLEIPERNLDVVVSAAENCFRRASMMMQDLNVSYYSIPTCYPGRETEGRVTDRRTSGFFDWFLSLFARMVEKHPEVMRNRALLWPESDPYFFRKLKFFAYAHRSLFSGEEVFSFLLKVDPEIFWDYQVSREVLFLIQDRWGDFSRNETESLIEKMLLYSEKGEGLKREENVLRVAAYVKFLSLNGCELSPTHTQRLAELIATVPNWRDEFAKEIVRKRGGNFGYVKVDEAPAVFDGLSVNEISEILDNMTGRGWGDFFEKKPFIGLVKNNPKRSLLVLLHKARRNDYPAEFWFQLIDKFPENVTRRFLLVFARELGRLPFEKIEGVKYYIGRWIEDNLNKIYTLSPLVAWSFFDHFVSNIITDRSDLGEDGAAKVIAMDEATQRSRCLFECAINEPAGHAMEGILKALETLGIKENAGIPGDFRERIERFLDNPGKEQSYAICILTRYIGRLYLVDPAWVMTRLVPLFSFNNDVSEFAWSGFSYSDNNFPPEVAVTVKPYLLQIFPKVYEWKWPDGDIEFFVDLLSSMALFGTNEPRGLTYREMRSCLRKMNDRSRSRVIHFLTRFGCEKPNGWVDHVVPFITNAWPLERKYRTSSSVSEWVLMLSRSGDNFPTVLQAVRKFLVPVSSGNGLLSLDVALDEDETLVSRFPEEVLSVLDAIIPETISTVPFELSQMLSEIEKAAPELVRNKQFLRLIDLVESQ